MPPKSCSSRRHHHRLQPSRQPAVERLEGRAVLAAGPLASIPDLVPSSDSGWSSSDNKTSITTPTFAGTASEAIVVSLFDGPTLLGSTPVVDGRWSFTAPSPLANGRHAISARAWAAGAPQPGAASRPLAVTVNTAAPLPTTIALAAAADSGLKADGRTNVPAPTLVGRAQPGTIIGLTLVRGASSTAVGAVAVPKSGSWRFRLPALSDGTYTVTTSVENTFGRRTSGASLPLTIDTLRPTIVSISDFAGQSTIALRFSKAVTGVTLRNLWISGTATEFGVIPPMPLSDSRVRSFFGPGAIGIASGTQYRDVYTVVLSRAFAEQGTYTLSLVAKGITDQAGNLLAGNATKTVTP